MSSSKIPGSTDDNDNTAPAPVSFHGQGNQYMNNVIQGEARVQLGNSFHNHHYPNSIPSSPAPRSLLPMFYSRDEDFVGRSELLNRLATKLPLENKHSRVTLTVIGGIGKSQIAIEFGYRYAGIYPGHWIFWVPSFSKDRFIDGYQEIAAAAGIPGHDKPDADILALVWRWLSDPNNGHWLLILDSADHNGVFFQRDEAKPNRKELSKYIPKSSHGSVLITSRNGTGVDLVPAGSMNEEKINNLPPQAAIQLLKKRVQGVSNKDATSLVIALEKIPLAIVQAAAYIDNSAITVNQYLEIFQSNEVNQTTLLGKSWINDRNEHGEDVDNAILKSWKMTYNKLGLNERQVLGMLSVAFDCSRMPLSPIGEQEFCEALGCLSKFAFVQKDSELHPGRYITYSMHSLVQVCTKAWVKRHGELHLNEREAVGTLTRMFGTDLKASLHQLLKPHVVKALSCNTLSPADRTIVGSMLAWSHASQGEYDRAESMLKSGISNMHDVDNETNDAIAFTNMLLLPLYRVTRQVEKSESICKQILSMRRSGTWMVTHALINALRNIIFIFEAQDNLDEAEMLCQDHIVSSTANLGSHDIYTLEMRMELCNIWMKQDRLDDVMALYEEIGPIIRRTNYYLLNHLLRYRASCISWKIGLFELGLSGMLEVVAKAKIDFGLLDIVAKESLNITIFYASSMERYDQILSVLREYKADLSQDPIISDVGGNHPFAKDLDKAIQLVNEARGATTQDQKFVCICEATKVICPVLAYDVEGARANFERAGLKTPAEMAPLVGSTHEDANGTN